MTFVTGFEVSRLLSSLPEESPSEMCSPASTEENIGLFMLRKDSERRATLHRVLTDYITLVVGNIEESAPQVSGLQQRTSKRPQLRINHSLKKKIKATSLTFVF